MTTTTTASQTWSPLGPTTAGWSPTPPRRTGTVSGLGPGLPSARLAVAHLCPAPLPRQPPLVWPGEPWESPASSCQRRAPPWAETTRGREASRRPPPWGLPTPFTRVPAGGRGGQSSTGRGGVHRLRCPRERCAQSRKGDGRVVSTVVSWQGHAHAKYANSSFNTNTILLAGQKALWATFSLRVPVNSSERVSGGHNFPAFSVS